MFTCRICGVEKDESEFSVNRTTRAGHRHECKSCSSEAGRRRYAARPLPQPGETRTCNSCKEEKDVSEFWKNQFRCKPCHVTIMRQSYEKSPWAQRARSINHRAGCRFVTGEDLKAIFERHAGRCYYCDRALEGEAQSGVERGCTNLTFDHVVPGVHREDNLALCCYDCNRMKNHNTAESLERFLKKMIQWRQG